MKFDTVPIHWLLQNFPLVKSLIEKEQEEKDKKKKNKSNKSTLKKPCPAYALWLKDQWTEVNLNKNLYILDLFLSPRLPRQREIISRMTW